MKTKPRPPFDPNAFLVKVAGGKTVSSYRKDQIVFSQGGPADAVFYIQKGKIKITVISEHGKEAVVALLGNHGNLDLALLDVKNCIRGPALGKDDLIFPVG